ncbi:MAG: hypothetical protein JSV36_22145 [Anaerolineae bacterium]|nr:MAG: hypothetical protein JSV36_22145 [Anaerolineae bacterium]
MSILRNGNFEADWAEEQSHRCLVFPADGPPVAREIGNIFTPPGWTVWFRHEEGVWSQPECRDARSSDPDRMHSGDKGFLLFTFFRKHDAGLMQQVNVEPGARLRFSAWAHAWSNHQDPGQPDKFPHPDKSRWSEGAGFDPFFALAGTSDDANIQNFTFWVGVDPTGGTDPFAASVVWGKGAHIYNAFHEVPEVQTVALVDTVTVFMRSQTLWRFKHNDAYWDDAALTVTIEGDDQKPELGMPREPYNRVYNVIPAHATEEQAVAIFLEAWRRSRETVGSSYDDAMMGPGLTSRTANLYGIPASERAEFLAFRDTHYPGVIVNFLPVPGEGLSPGEAIPTVTRERLSLHLQTEVEGWGDFVENVKPAWVKVFHFGLAPTVKSRSPETKVLVRFHLQDYGWLLENPDKRQAARDFLALFWPSLEQFADDVDCIEGLNETIATHDPGGVQKSVDFAVALSDEMVARGNPAAVCMLNVAVGNPDHGPETEMLLPAAQAAVRNGHYLGYHPYWPATPNQDWLESAWRHYAGRALVSWDTTFTQAGLRPRYLFTEAGPIGTVPTPEGKPGGLMPTEGWRSPECLDGNWNRCLEQLLTFRRLLAEWNAENQNRAEGVMLFTSGIGVGWERFQYGKTEFELLEAALRD